LPSYQLPVWVWPIVLVIACALAASRGRDAERLAAATVLLAWSLTMVVFQGASEGTQWLVMMIDVAQLPIFLWLALRSPRYWPLFAAAFKLLLVVTHLSRAIDPTISGWAYQTAGVAWSYLALFVIVYAAWTAPRRYAEIEADETVAIALGPASLR
jgi:hypothetical protein